MGALDAVLQLKSQEDASRLQQNNATQDAVKLFLQAQQNARQYKLDELTMRAGLAKDGIKLSNDGTFVRDESLKSPVEKFLEQGKMASAAKAIYDAGGPFIDLYGNTQGQQQDTSSSSDTNVQNPVSSKDGNVSVNTQGLDPIQARKAKEQEIQKNLELQAKNQEALGADAATRYSGAVNGIKNINDIVNAINNSPKKNNDLIYEVNLMMQADNTNSSGGFFAKTLGDLPMVKGAYRASKLARVSDEGKALANSFSVLAENMLRARTGAAAPEPEIVREYARDLFKTFQESPGTWYKKLMNEYDFLSNTHNEIRPMRAGEIRPPRPILTDEQKLGNTQSVEPMSILDQITFEPAAGMIRGIIQGKGATAGAANPSETSYLKKSQNAPIEGNPDEIAKNFVTGFGRDLAATTIDSLTNPSTYVIGSADKIYSAAKNAVKAAKMETIVDSFKPLGAILNKKSANAVVKEKPQEAMTNLVKATRENLKSPTGYIAQEHSTYAKAIDTIKATDAPVKNIDDVLNNLADEKNGFRVIDSSGKSTWTNKEAESAFNKLNEIRLKNGSVSENDLLAEMKKLRGNFVEKPNVDKASNIRAASVLGDGFGNSASKVYNAANSRYRNFKREENDLHDLIGIYGQKSYAAQDTDNVVNNLLLKDFGPEQIKVLSSLKDKTGIDLPGAIKTYGGNFKLLQAINPRYRGLDLKEMVKGAHDIVTGKAAKKSSEFISELKSKPIIESSVSKSARQVEQNKRTLENLMKQESEATAKEASSKVQFKKDLIEKYKNYKQNPSEFRKSIKNSAKQARKKLNSKKPKDGK